MGIRFLLIISGTVMLSACESSSMTKGATSTIVEMKTVETKVQAFFGALHRGDLKEAQVLYPAFQKLENHQRTDTAIISSIFENEDVLVVSVHHAWHNKSGNPLAK